MNSHQIPIVDFSFYEINQSECIRQLKYACENVGFFYLKNHGFAQESIDDIFSCVEEKIKYNIDESHYGYIGYRHETGNPDNQIMGDAKESFNICKLNEQDEPSVVSPFPPLFKEKKKLISEISKGSYKLCLKLLELFAIALEIPESEGGKNWFFDKHKYELDSFDCLRVLHYPAVDKIIENDIRAGIVLFQKDIGGLEVLLPNSTEWIPVPIIPGCIVINIGDCLEFWTRGLYKSIKHRVTFKEDNLNFDRYSIVYFFHPTIDVKLESIPSKFVLNGKNEKAEEMTLNAGQYLLNKLQKIHASDKND
ncbi:837_t:CDS:2 [Diversispora eburnea]|uniref:837_t:CDS:1 n=1 Tax=Diversispora eburnea TaxID=1213867 RepID=A0A9N8ZKU0_9GLOM|nr:837_t:CDS:2 [Diversispora eburnea]